MKLNDIAPKNAKPNRKRRGQGNGTGNGTFGGRGMNGQNSRAGGGVRPGFEGGQTPLIMRMPKNPGFRNPNRIENQSIDISVLEKICKAGDKVDRAYLVKAGIIDAKKGAVKILASGEITKKVEIVDLKCSAGAVKAIEKAGGSVKLPTVVEKVPKADKK